MTDSEQDNLGIYSNHAYTLLSIFPNLPYKGGHVTLLKVRNPWGRKEWKGDWSYYSSAWTKELKERLDYNLNPHDGSFYMSYENFMMYFDFVNICQVNLAYVNSYLTF
jgi:calpain-15